MWGSQSPNRTPKFTTLFCSSDDRSLDTPFFRTCLFIAEKVGGGGWVTASCEGNSSSVFGVRDGGV